MSYFLCGEFVLEEGLSTNEKTGFAFDAIHESWLNRISLQLGPCIVQPIVFEIIGKPISNQAERELPFLITSSPISDVSDGLIDLDDIDGGLERLEQTLSRVQSFLSGIGRTGMVAEATIYFSEGFDDNYRLIESSLGMFTADCMKVFEVSGEIDSLRVWTML